MCDLPSQTVLWLAEVSQPKMNALRQSLTALPSRFAMMGTHSLKDLHSLLSVVDRRCHDNRAVLSKSRLEVFPLSGLREVS